MSLGAFSKEGSEKTFWTATRNQLVDGGKRKHIPSLPSAMESPTVLGVSSLPCDYLPIWHVAQHPKGLACVTHRADAAQEAFLNPGIVKHLVLDLPSTALKGMESFP